MLFSSLKDSDFFDRQQELTGLFKRVLQADVAQARSAVLSGQRGIGKTELLRQLFGRLFWEQDRVAPFLYTVNPALLSVIAFSRNFLFQFLCQRLAFPEKEQALLSRDGISIEGLFALAEERKAVWAKDLLGHFAQCACDPVAALRIALAAPHRSAMATGMPVAVLIDDFHRIKGLHDDGAPDPRLAFLFEDQMAHGKTPHIVTGNMAELQELPVVNKLERIPVLPLGPEGTSSMIRSLLNSYEAEGSVPPLLLRHLGGNPFYLECVVTRACAKNNPDDGAFWKAYIRELMDGPLALSWLSVLKIYFPDLVLRRTALEITHRIFHASEALSCRRIAETFALTVQEAHDIAQALYLAGLIRAEFGVLRAVEDRVLREIIDALYLRELLAKTAHESEEHFLSTVVPQKGRLIRFDMTLPMTREAELIAAQGLEQIGKNLDLDRDAVGQLQIAVIEACINAIEHSRGMGDSVYVSVSVDDDHMEVSVESAGKEYIVQETGEPVRDQENAKTTGRGWGIKLMKRFVDEVRFEKTIIGTKIILIKKIERSADIHKEDTANRE